MHEKELQIKNDDHNFHTAGSPKSSSPKRLGGLNTMLNYFSGYQGLPYHLSIGAVLVNSEGKVACHSFEKINDLEQIVCLMRESINPNETIEDCLARGLMEEFGAKATIREFLGTIVSHFHDQDRDIEKTTLYFLVELLEQHDAWRSPEDEERGSQILWLTPQELIEKMDEQFARIGREDLHESAILHRIAEKI